MALRSVHSQNDQRQRNERPHADHIDHVQRNRARQPNTPYQPLVLSHGSYQRCGTWEKLGAHPMLSLKSVLLSTLCPDHEQGVPHIPDFL